MTYALGIVLPLIVLGAVFINSAEVIVQGQIIDVAGVSNSQMADRLDTLLESYPTLVDQYAMDRLFVAELRRNYHTVMDAFDFYIDLWQRQRSNLLAWPNVRNITIYTENSTLVSTTPFLIRTDSGAIDRQVLTQVERTGYRGLWSGVRNVYNRYEYWNPKKASDGDSVTQSFSYSRSLKTDNSALGASAMITVEVDATALTSILTSGMEGMESILVDERGAVVSGGELPRYLLPQPDWTAASPLRLDYRGSDYLLWNTPLSNGWRLISAVSLDVISAQARAMRTAGLTVLVLLAVVALGAIGVISEALTRRVRLLVEKMRSVDATTQTLKAIGGHDEISVLDRAFTDMTGRLRDSVKKQYSAEVRRKEAELDLLHTQVNPHFLYNMLSTVAWLADSRPPEVVRAAVEKLAGYYRITLARGEEVIPLRDELHGLDAYLELQQLRYSGRLRCLVDVDEALLETPIPRLTLQPLVENSITHGAGVERRPISILITGAVQGERLCLTVRDDGVGMDADRLEQLDRGVLTSTVGSGLGYRNVAERIRLHFGEPYGLSVSSVPGQGTAVRIVLPLRPPAEE